jgi:hypothetical protein
MAIRFLVLMRAEGRAGEACPIPGMTRWAIIPVAEGSVTEGKTRGDGVILRFIIPKKYGMF